MSTSKHIDKICIAAVCLTLVLTILFACGEKLGITVVPREEDENISGMFSANDLNAEWDTAGACNVILNGDSAKISGTGAYFRDNTLYIVYAGKYVISGTLDGSIHIDADGDDKIWLLFDGVDITSETEPPLYIKQADKVFLTLQENSQNTLAFENNEGETKIDGCIFSRDDLTINGKGNLTVTATGLHGIVCNDSLVFAGGNIHITAKVDGVHAQDAIKICNTTLTVSAGDDGLHAGNDDESSVFYLESGNINITECYEGIEANSITIAGGTVYITPSDDGINANGSGRTSLITISGGDITVINRNGRDADGFDSNGSIHITGGNVFISVTGAGTNNAMDYGSENGGKYTVSGGTVIACGSSQMTEYPDSDSTQGFIMGMISGGENETISVLNADGKEIIRKEIPCSFTSVIVSSPDIAVGDTVTLKVGDTEAEVIANKTGSGGRDGFGNMSEEPKGTPPEMPGGDDPRGPQMPGGDDPGGPQIPGENVPGGNRGLDNEKWQNPMLENKADNLNDRTEQSNKSSDIPVSTWIMIGISAIVLIGGLLVAVKKKY